MKKTSPKPPVTRSEIEALRSRFMHQCRTETDPLVRAWFYTEIENCHQKLERDFGVPHPAG